MPPAGPHEFFKQVVECFESHYDSELLRNRVLTGVESGDIDRLFLVLVSEINKLRLPKDSRLSQLISRRKNLPSLLKALRGSLCMLGGTVDQTLGLKNVFAGRGPQDEDGHRIGKRHLELHEALITSSFFSIPWMFLFGGTSEYPWYNTNDVPLFPKKIKPSASYVYGYSIEGKETDKKEKQGKKEKPEDSEENKDCGETIRVGLTFYHSDVITDLALTTSSCLPPPTLGEWDLHLLKLAIELGVDLSGPSLMCVERPVAYQRLRVFHLLMYDPKDFRSKVNVYCRLLSSSSVWLMTSDERIYEPLKNRERVVRLINLGKSMIHSSAYQASRNITKG